MIKYVRRNGPSTDLWTALIVAVVLFAAAYFGLHASIRWLVLLAAATAALLILENPVLGLLALVAAALVLPLEIVTGTEVKLNPAAVLIPGLLVLWMLDMVRRRNVRLVPSPTTLPLVLFLLAGLLSLFIGRVPGILWCR